MQQFLRARFFPILAGTLILISVARIVSSYSHTAQAFDEPCHVAAGIELLDRHTYLLDPMHPPLARIAIGLPLLFAGDRYPTEIPNGGNGQNYNVVGNKIIYGEGDFRHNLVLARLGVLPFFLLGALIVWRWSDRIGGKPAALCALFFYCTTPSILAFSSIAYTDIVAASTEVLSLYAFSVWVENPSRSHTVFLGIALGLAFGSKFTSFLFLPPAFVSIAVIWFFKVDRTRPVEFRQRLGKLVVSALLSGIVLWGCYGFSLRPMDEAIGLSASNMPSFQHFPAAMRGTLQKLVLLNPRVPAPELLHGLSEAWVLNKEKSFSYLLGQLRLGGWWYFFPVALLVKLPLPLIVGGVAALLWLRKCSEALYPLAGLTGILLISTQVGYQVGTRHVLICVVLICIVAGIGISRFLEWPALKPFGLSVCLALFAWQCVESARSQSDFLAYFNATAGRDPGHVLVEGCDLDCGQDMYALSDELRARHVTHLTLATWSSADLDSLNLPPFDVPRRTNPSAKYATFERRTGWIAISSRAMYTGDFLHDSLSPGSLDWLRQYKPVTRIGKTIDLYFIEP